MRENWLASQRYLQKISSQNILNVSRTNHLRFGCLKNISICTLRTYMYMNIFTMYTLYVYAFGVCVCVCGWYFLICSFYISWWFDPIYTMTIFYFSLKLNRYVWSIFNCFFFVWIYSIRFVSLSRFSCYLKLIRHHLINRITSIYLSIYYYIKYTNATAFTDRYLKSSRKKKRIKQNRITII